MAISSPSLALSMEAMFGNIKPATDLIRKIGGTDFTDKAPEYVVKPGASIKVPVSAVTAASAYHADNNNYLTGGTTTWATLSSTHYLQGFDITGVDVDSGIDAPRMKQLFTARAGLGIAAAIQGNLKGALDLVTASTGVTIPAVGTADADDYLSLAGSVGWLDRMNSVLCVNGAELASIKSSFAALNVVPPTLTELAQYMGFKDLVLVPGMTSRAVIVPAGSVGFLGRVPTIIADYREFGAQSDPETGLSVGIVVANDQAHNRVVANADMWFGTAFVSANAAATTAGAINVGTTSVGG